MAARCLILVLSLWMTVHAASVSETSPSVEDIVKGLVERLKSTPELQAGRAHVCRRLTVF